MGPKQQLRGSLETLAGEGQSQGGERGGQGHAQRAAAESGRANARRTRPYADDAPVTIPGQHTGKTHGKGVYAQHRETAELKEHRLEQQGRQNGGKSRPAQQHAHQTIENQMSAGKTDGNMDQRTNKKGRRKNAHGHQTVVIQFAQADGRARRRQSRARAKYDRGEDAFRDMHVVSLRRFRAGPGSAPSGPARKNACFYLVLGAANSSQSTAPSSTGLSWPL